MGHVDVDRLNRLLGDPELAWVLERVRRRLELGQPLTGTIAQRSATPGQRDAIARLLGRAPRSARGVSVSLPELDAWLRRAGICEDGLAAAVVALGGPVTVRTESAARDGRRWEQAFAGLEAACADRPVLAAWVRGARGDGLVKRLAGGDPQLAGELCDALALIVRALDGVADGESLGSFAARVCGRAHALDDGSPLGTLALGAVRAVTGRGAPLPGESPAEARREAWAAGGVLCDDLSSHVLTLRLPGDASVTGRMLSAARTGDEPAWLTLRQLVRAPVSWRALGVLEVLVVENPAVVTLAASRAITTPIVCTNGQPRAATMVLLRALAQAGVALSHHGDFDWPGLTIGNLLQRRLAMTARAFDRDAYLAAVRDHPRAGPLRGAPVAASWDPALGEAMREAGRQIEEELVAEELLAQLG